MTSTPIAVLICALSAGSFTTEQIFPHHPLHNHSSSIVELPGGDLLAAWYRGSGEGDADDVQIMGARKSSGAEQWSDPFILADTPDHPDLNPVLFLDPRQRLWLFYSTPLDNSISGVLIKYCLTRKYGNEGPPEWEQQNVLHCRPRNFEQSYGDLLKEIDAERAEDIAQNPKLRAICEQQKELVRTKIGRRLGWMTRTPPVTLSENRMMLGVYSDAFACSIAAFTEDGGRTWTFSEPIQAVHLGCIQPAFAQRSDGALIAYMRDNGKPKQIRVAESQDNGVTWSCAIPSDIPNPGSSVALLTLRSGAWLLVCNDLKKGRHRLTAFLSDNEGKTWSARRVIEDIGEGNGEVHYPTLIQSTDGAIHLSYTHTQPPPRRETIVHARFNEEWLREN
ncbi:MAG TPA: exo-alpha-sialidase [bacterium]|nr:exo-alpha-sialidase [bacterium]